MINNTIPINWWRDEIINALKKFGGEAANKDIKQYFLDNHSNYIFKSIKKSSLDGSINGQLQFFSKKDGGNNYKGNGDYFHKIRKGLWSLNEYQNIDNISELINKFSKNFLIEKYYRYKSYSRCGVYLIGAGFVLQIISNYV